MSLKLFSLFSHYDIELLKNYITFSEDNLKKYQDGIAQTYDDRTINMTIDEKNDFDIFFEHNWIKSEFSYPSLMRKSIFLSTYAYFENQLIKICSALQDEDNILLDVNDLKGSSLDKVKVYISKACNRKFPVSQSEWQLLIQYRNLRNSIAHEYGEIMGDEVINQNKINQLKGIEFYENKIDYTDKFNVIFVDTIDNVLAKLIRM